jgi:iron complex outermembrane recepter protein
MRAQRIRRRLLASSAIACGAALALLLAGAAAAQPRTYDIPSESLSQALRDYGRQSGLQVIFTEDLVRGRIAPGVKGSFEAEAALKTLLSGTGLHAQSTPAGVVMIEKDRGPTGAAAPAAAEPAQLSGLTVTGTRLEGVPKDGPQELRTYSHEQIEASGQPSIARFLNTLPAVSQNSTGWFQNQGGQNTVQLRGFPVGTTLVLLDGHHAPNSGLGAGNAFDINNIPEGLLERVDILPLGSSAVYGSDALAGVVNFVLRRNFDGLELTGGYGAASHYIDRSATVIAGRKFDRGDVGVGVSYEVHHALTVAERPAIASGDFSRFAALGGHDARTASCLPGTVFALSGNLPGIGAPFALIPAGLVGRPSISDFIPGANQMNTCNALRGDALIPQMKRLSGLAYGDYDVTDRVHLYGTALIGRLTNLSPESPELAVGFAPSTNAFNPFGVPVFVAGDLPIFSSQKNMTQFRHVELGLRGDLLAGWSWDANAHLTQDEDKIAERALSIPGVLAAEASSDPATAINLFSSVDPGPGLAKAFFTPSLDYGDRSEVVQVIFRGPLLRLPAGPVEAALGAQYERQKFTSVTRGGILFSGAQFLSDASGARHLGSLFAEMRAPLLASFNGGQKPALAISAAVRYDRFSDFGRATTPQFGLEFRPNDSLLLRASFSKAFRAPTLFALNGPPTTFNFRLTDPKQGGVLVVVPVTSGGNPGLRPETGRSWSVGGIWTSARFPGLTASATYWNIHEQNRITTLDAQMLLDNEALFPGKLIRDASGRLVSLDNRFLNFGDLQAAGVDVDLAYNFETPLGQWTPSLSLTKTTRFEAAITPGSPLENRLSRATDADAWAPALKATANLGWHRGSFSASVTGRYLGRYLDYQEPANNNHLGNYWLADASLRIALDQYVRGRWPRLSGADLSISAVNLFNRGPQYSNLGFGVFGFDPAEYDILGRLVTVRLGARW